MGLSDRAAPAFVRLAAHPLRWRLLTELAGSDLRVRELVTRIGQPQNLLSYHLRLLRGAGLVTATRSSLDGRDSYYHLDLDRCAQHLASSGAALHPALGRDPALPQRLRRTPRLAVLFVCTGNSARSPIAEALLHRDTAGQVTVTSAGSHPRTRMHPETLRVLREQFDVDIADRRPQHLDTLAGQRFDHVITLCDRVREVCPEFGAHSHRTHWSVPDPTSTDGHRASTESFARVAADIETRVRHLLSILATQTIDR